MKPATNLRRRVMIAAASTWLMAGACIIAARYAYSAMGDLAKLSVRGGACTGIAGACDTGQNCTTTGGNCPGAANCPMLGVGNSCDPDNQYYLDNGSQAPVCVPNNNAKKGCGHDNAQIKCLDVIYCVCAKDQNMNWSCNAVVQPDQIGNCLSGTPAP